jgi:molecular chaperone HscB
MVNYFELFALPIDFNIDLQKLSANYQELQKLTHPDKFAGQSDQQQRLAIQKNAQVNDGYQVLKSNISRAEHILTLRGLDIQHETQTMQDVEFLMQQMQWREMLEDADNSANPQDILEDLIENVEHQQTEIKRSLANWLAQSSDSANDAAANDIRKLKFTDKMLNEISEKEEQLFN